MLRSLAALVCVTALGACSRATTVCSDSPDPACGVGDARERQIAEPLAIAIVAARGDAGGVPAIVTFGGAGLGKTALYLRFAPLSVDSKRIERAFLRLEPATTGPFDRDPVRVEVWRVSRDWSAARLQRSNQPSLAPPLAHALAEARKPLRVDVTDLVREAEQHPQRSHGMAVLAAGGDGHGQSFATGIDGGWLPRLEVYLR